MITCTDNMTVANPPFSGSYPNWIDSLLTSRHIYMINNGEDLIFTWKLRTWDLRHGDLNDLSLVDFILSVGLPWCFPN